nr:ABC transporter ATP-binding protein [Bacillus coahuilensis]
MNHPSPLLRVQSLKTSFFTDRGEIPAVDDITFHIHEGEIVGIVGESGCGKSVTSLSIMGLIPSPPGKITGGEIFYGDEDLTKASEKRMRDLRGNEIAMIFQEPMTSLNPVFTIGNQMLETIRLHKGWNKKDSLEHAITVLKLVGLPRAEELVKEYPHQLSGGMRQRVMIAMAMACEPKLLIADEPTTALDVTIQAQILKLMKDLNERTKTAIMLITHDLGVVAEVCDRVIVMYSGKVVEQGAVEDIFTNPSHPYTKGLLQSVPDIRQQQEKLYSIPGNVPKPGSIKEGCRFAPRCYAAFDRCSVEHPNLLEVQGDHRARCFLVEEEKEEAYGASIRSKPLSHFAVKGGLLKPKGSIKAVNGVSFTLKRGETLGIVGESGCGKSTTGRLLMRLLEPTTGTIKFEDKDLTTLSKSELRKTRRDIQMVFQDPFASLNPRHTVEKILEEPLIVHGIGDRKERKRQVQEMLEVVGLSSYHLKRYPHQFSGGQRQRIGIARALMTKPKLIIADEPVSALDVSIQSQVLNLLEDLQKEFQLTYIFIAHDLGVVRHISDRVGVMYLGKMVELSTSDELYTNPLHPYTKSLISSVPIPDPLHKREKIILQGDIPSPANPPSGCTFHTRCPVATDLCTRIPPTLQPQDKNHFVSCHLYSTGT